MTTEQDVDTPVPNYVFPDQVSPGADNTYTFSEATGLFTWNSPQVTCGFWLTFEVEEYSLTGDWLSTSMRSVYIQVLEQGNLLPQITTEPSSVSEPNLPANVNLAIEANDADQQVRLEAFSELLQNGAASFTAPVDFEPGPVAGEFSLVAGLDLARPYSYYLILRASDDLSQDQPGVRFRVIELALGDVLSTSGPLASAMTLELAPNPVSDLLQVRWDQTLTKGARLEVWQTDGRMVLHQPLDSGQRALELPVSSWQAGTYWLVIRSSEGWLSQPFVKQ